MNSRRFLGVVLGLALAATPIAGASSPGGNVVTVADGHFLCFFPKCRGGTIAHPRLRKTIETDQRIVWAWSISNHRLHNVTLRRHPKRVDPEPFSTPDLDYPEKVKMRFRVPGKYVFVCTHHPHLMRLYLTVKPGKT